MKKLLVVLTFMICCLGFTAVSYADEPEAENTAVLLDDAEQPVDDIAVENVVWCEDGNWYYVIGDQIQWNYTGIKSNEWGSWRIVNGKVDFDFTGLAPDEYGWWYIELGKVNYDYTGIKPNEYGWWKITNGQVDFNFTGLAPNEYGWWYLEYGLVRFDYTGIKPNEYGWWKITGGQVDFNFTGLAPNEYGWWYLEDGLVRFDYTGIKPNEYGWWKITGGQVDFNYTGLASNEYGWWKITDGLVDFSFTGLEYNEYGWWYLEGGQVLFDATGICRNDYGLWYYSKGCVDFDYCGEYCVNEDTSTNVLVEYGKVVEYERVYIGDSRTVFMSYSGERGEGFIAKNSIAYDYFVVYEIPQLEKMIQLMPGIKSVVFNAGVNDIHVFPERTSEYAAAYANVINRLIRKYPNIKFYFASIYHIDKPVDNMEYINPSLNPKIDEFNAIMKENCQAEYIPLQEYVAALNIESEDGLHITDASGLRRFIAGYTIFS